MVSVAREPSANALRLNAGKQVAATSAVAPDFTKFRRVNRALISDFILATPVCEARAKVAALFADALMQLLRTGETKARI